MLALIMFGYALLEKDVPVGMIALAVIAGLTPEGQKIGSVNISQSFRQMMYGFSLTLFIGALFIMLF